MHESTPDAPEAKIFNRWATLLDSAGFETSRNGEVVNLKTKNVLQEFPLKPTELEFQIIEKVDFSYEVGETAYAAKAVQSPNVDTIYYVENNVPIRAKINVGDSLEIALKAAWKNKNGTLLRQTVFAGNFIVPAVLDKLGAPGYNIFIESMKSNLFLSVGNVIQKETGDVFLEILQASFVLL